MSETIWYCPVCENAQIATANQAWCSATDACDGVWMVEIGYLDGNKPIYKDIQEPKVVR